MILQATDAFRRGLAPVERQAVMRVLPGFVVVGSHVLPHPLDALDEGYRYLVDLYHGGTKVGHGEGFAPMLAIAAALESRESVA